ncbi:hypothetical protein QBC43DRAFT_78266 [Cladorrhinum sp. PSN259]|nr:hypothetical protein QBC43DRAFT_78266 [Cladorrhinum sp. PSN259]
MQREPLILLQMYRNKVQTRLSQWALHNGARWLRSSRRSAKRNPALNFRYSVGGSMVGLPASHEYVRKGKIESISKQESMVMYKANHLPTPLLPRKKAGSVSSVASVLKQFGSGTALHDMTTCSRSSTSPRLSFRCLLRTTNLVSFLLYFYNIWGNTGQLRYFPPLAVLGVGCVLKYPLCLPVSRFTRHNRRRRQYQQSCTGQWPFCIGHE